MKQYKVVKAVGYDYIYKVYRKIFCFWQYIGHVSSANDDSLIIEKAKQLVSPKTLYFSE